MTSERWQEVEEVLQVVLDTPPTERAAVLEEVCAGDDELKTEANLLVRAFDEAGEFLEQPAIAQDARVLIGELPDDNIGRMVGPYRIIELLGAGGMSEVYLAQDTRLGRLVALKILPAYFLSDETRLSRFQREARAASALNHPNVLTIHEVGASNDVQFIATEFIDGQTIRELILRQSLTVEEVVDIAVQVASGLVVAHAAGIVHRDIKPENIMRRNDRIVKILDFGIAKLTEQLPQELAGESPTLMKAQTEVGLVMGTVGYMSPEQARALVVDERTDIWSFGCVLYEILAGRAPFAGATRLDTLVAILEREPPPFIESTKDAPAVLKRLQDIVTKTLRKERSERYQTVNALLDDLKSVQDELFQLTPLERQAILERLLAARDVGNEDGKSSAPASATNAELPDASSERMLANVSAWRPSRGGLMVMLAAAVLVFAFAWAFLYQRFVAPRRVADNPNATAAAKRVNQKLYTQMSEAEQLAFVDEQAQRISALMGEHPAELSEDAQRVIKSYVDRYVERTGSLSREYGKEDLRVIYGRAPQFIPLIARSFNARKVPVIIGIYLPMIEAEYKPCFENSIGAKGLFQFLPQTAQQYGVAPADMCDVEKMTPAAAHYIADRMAELGDDAESMTLVLLSYNRGPEWVRDTLRQLRGTTDDYERNFWTLFARRDQLDESFRQESAGYVPAFFAAAIIGENPHNFELQIPPLSTLTSTENTETTKRE